MLSLDHFLVFALISFTLAATPGPNMIYLISVALANGKSAALTSLMGIVTAIIIHITLVSAGLTAIFISNPLFLTVLKFFGIAYLLFLAFNTIKSNKKITIDTTKNDRRSGFFYKGLVINLLNPKMIIFYFSFFPQFIDSSKNSVAIQSLQLGATQVIIAFLVHFTVISFASKIAATVNQNPTWIIIQKYIVAVVLVVIALLLLFV